MNPTHNLFQNNYPQNSLYLCIMCICVWIWSSCSGCASWGHALVGRVRQGGVRASAGGRGAQTQLEGPGAQLSLWPKVHPFGRGSQCKWHLSGSQEKWKLSHPTTNKLFGCHKMEATALRVMAARSLEIVKHGR